MTFEPPIRVELTEGWQLSARAGRLVPEALRGRSIPATVPGVVHTDLLAAGEIDDPYLDDNESRYAWIGSTDWSYRTTAALPAGEHDRVDLVIGGLDTVAAVSIDGEVVLRTANQHRSHRVGVPRSATGSADFAVDFSAPIPAADAASLALGYRPHVNHHPYNALRKMACSFGWDWGIDTSTSGIWRPIALEAWSVARLNVVLPSTRVDGADGVASFAIEVERSRDDDLEVVVQLAGQTVVVPVHGTSAQVEVRVPDAELWWPRGYGSPTLYPTTVELRTVAVGASLGTWSRELGFRTIELNVDPDEHGTPFAIVVNGQPIAVRGANWIPDDAFPHRVTRARYADRLEQAEFAGLNLIRVWGGGIYESDDFYAETDARGILVWQDFLLACAAYAEEEPLRSEIEAEAREAVTRLASHPSLAILNGTTRTSGATKSGTGSTGSMGPRGVPTTTTSSFRRSCTSSRRTWPTRPVVPTRPARLRAVMGPRKTPRATARCTSGISGTRRTTRTIATTGRASWPSSAGNRRHVVDARRCRSRRPADTRVARHACAPKGDRRQRQAHRRPRCPPAVAERDACVALGHAAQSSGRDSHGD